MTKEQQKQMGEDLRNGLEPFIGIKVNDEVLGQMNDIVTEVACKYLVDLKLRISGNQVFVNDFEVIGSVKVQA